MARVLGSIYTPSEWQKLFHSLPYDEVLGAGAAGPGKSMALLFDPIYQVVAEHERCNDKKHPHHQPWGQSVGRALHLRRNMQMLDETVNRSIRWFPIIDPDAKFVGGNSPTWTFKSGYKYQFGHCKDPSSWQLYLGGEFTYIAWDELTQFEEEQYDQINLRLRTSDPVLQPMMKIRACSNPMTKQEGAETIVVKNPHWVRDRFVKPFPAGKRVIERAIKRRDGSVRVMTQFYLPATLYDNPDKEFVRDYEVKLLKAPPHLRKAFLDGDWYITPGSFYGEVWNPSVHICNPFRIPDSWPVFRSMDWGYKNPGCVHWWAMDDDGNLFCTRELTFQGRTVVEVAALIRVMEERMGYWSGSKSMISGPADTQLWEERGQAARNMGDIMASMGVPWLKADKKSRTGNAGKFLARLTDHDNLATTPGIVFFQSCKEATTTIPAIPTSKKDSETPMDGGPDHWHDSVLYACAYASHGRRGIAERRRDPDDWEIESATAAQPRGRHGYGGML